MSVAGSVSMHLRLAGAGPVTLILDAGWGQWSPVWSLVQPRLAQRFTTCAVDRLGLGRSDAPQSPRSSFQIVDELEAALDALGLAGPYLYVGHSFGAVHGRVLAHRRAQVLGLVMVDPVIEALGLSPPFRGVRDAHLVRLRKLEVWARRGLLGPGAWLLRQPTYARKLPRRERVEVRRGFRAGSLQVMLAELSALDQSMEELKGLGAPRVPFEVLSAEADWLPAAGRGASGAETPVQAMHRKLAATSPLGAHRVVARSTHDLHVDAPEAVVAAVEGLAARLGLDGPRA